MHGFDQICRAEAGHGVPGERVRAEIFRPVFCPCRSLFLIIYGSKLLAGGGEGLDVLPAQHSAKACAAGRALIRDYAGVAHKVFSGGTDAELAEILLRQ